MARCTIPLWFLEIVDVDISGVLPGDDLVPLDGLDVAEVVVVQDADGSPQDISQRRHLQVMHL